MTTVSPHSERLESMLLKQYVALLDRLIDFVHSYFKEHDLERFPTVSECARRFRLRHSEIEILAEDSEVLILTSFMREDRLGAHCLESLDDRAVAMVEERLSR